MPGRPGDTPVQANPSAPGFVDPRQGGRGNRARCRWCGCPRRLPRVLAPEEVDGLIAALRTRRDKAVVLAVVLPCLWRCDVLGLAWPTRGSRTGPCSSLRAISTRITSTAPLRPFGAPTARRTGRPTAMTASSGPGLALPTAVLPVGAVHLHDPAHQPRRAARRQGVPGHPGRLRPAAGWLADSGPCSWSGSKGPAATAPGWPGTSPPQARRAAPGKAPWEEVSITPRWLGAAALVHSGT